jgi:hypothetical protein
MGMGTKPYSFHGNHPALCKSESDAVITLLGGSDKEQPTMSDVLRGITMEDYSPTNIDDAGMTSRNRWISHHTFMGRRSVKIPDKYKNSNFKTVET